MRIFIVPLTILFTVKKLTVTMMVFIICNIFSFLLCSRLSQGSKLENFQMRFYRKLCRDQRKTGENNMIELLLVIYEHVSILKENQRCFDHVWPIYECRLHYCSLKLPYFITTVFELLTQIWIFLYFWIYRYCIWAKGVIFGAWVRALVKTSVME